MAATLSLLPTRRHVFRLLAMTIASSSWPSSKGLAILADAEEHEIVARFDHFETSDAFGRQLQGVVRAKKWRRKWP